MTLRDFIEMARQKIGGPPKTGWNWACYCRVCCALREVAT
jgi:hypothetical protein